MIATETISLVPLDREHLQRTRVWANDGALAQLLDRARPVSDVEHEQWSEGIQNRQDAVFFAIESKAEGEHLGNVWLWNIDPRHRKAELRIVIGNGKAVGRGMGTEAIELICNYAIDRLNLRKIYAYVLGTNPRAVRAFEKSGFAIEGTLKEDRWVGDQYADVLLLAKFLSTETK